MTIVPLRLCCGQNKRANAITGKRRSRNPELYGPIRSPKKAIEKRMTEDLTQKRQAAYAALDAIPFMEKPWFFTSAYKEYQAKVETAERRLASLPTKIEMVHNTPDGGVVHNKWCHIFAIKRIHKSFVKSKKLDVAYSAARRRERTAKVAAYEADARRGSSSVRDSFLGELTATFACPYCCKKIRA